MNTRSPQSGQWRQGIWFWEFTEVRAEGSAVQPRSSDGFLTVCGRQRGARLRLFSDHPKQKWTRRHGRQPWGMEEEEVSEEVKDWGRGCWLLLMVCQFREQGGAQALQLSAFTMAWSWRIFYDCTETKGVCVCMLKQKSREVQSMTPLVADHTSRCVHSLAWLLIEEDCDGMWRKIWKTDQSRSRFPSLEHLIWEASFLMLIWDPFSYPDLSQSPVRWVSVVAVTKSTGESLHTNWIWILLIYIDANLANVCTSGSQGC